jgi:hypothetical protein
VVFAELLGFENLNCGVVSISIDFISQVQMVESFSTEISNMISRKHTNLKRHAEKSFQEIRN